MGVSNDRRECLLENMYINRCRVYEFCLLPIPVVKSPVCEFGGRCRRISMEIDNPTPLVMLINRPLDKLVFPSQVFSSVTVMMICGRCLSQNRRTPEL